MTNQVYACIGATASTPYYFDKVYVNVYTAEELCYVLFENAFLVDREFLKKDLVDWISQELKLNDLARELYSLLNQGAQSAAIVGTILGYVGFYSKDEIEKVESILRMNVSLSVFEKRKAKADFLYENRHFLLALKEYEELLKMVSEEEYELRSRIYNNMGVTYMSLYLYDSATECFKSAYEINNDKVAYRHYLLSRRMALPDDEYIRFLADEEEAYRYSVPLESELEEAKVNFEDTVVATRMRDVFSLKDKKEASLYYEEITHMTENLKADYRDIALETEPK